MKYCILGMYGFIGTALSKKLIKQGHDVVSDPTPDIDAVIHLASPTHLDFEKNPEYHIGESIASFQLLLPFCKTREIPFIYASSALVYETEKKTPFRNCKTILEQLAEGIGGHTLGLRIFPVYGVGENRTVISQWCRQMKGGEAPIIYGDGEQMRDFIYIDDVVDTIIRAIESKVQGIMDIGTGKATTLSEIVKSINELLDTSIAPVYVEPPLGYSKGIICQNPVPTNYTIHDGIKRILE